MKRFIAVVAAFLLMFTGGCGEKNDLRVKTAFYFNAPISVILPKKDFDKHFAAIDGILSELQSALDPENENSDVYKFNRLGEGEQITLNETVKTVLSLALGFYELTGGAFNPLIFPLTDLWGFSSEKYGKTPFTLPNSEEITAAVDLCKIENITLSGDTLIKNKAGAMLDFGGIAKGYAADLTEKYLKEIGVTRGYVSFGSSSTYLLKREENVPEWELGIRHPRGDDMLFKVPICDVQVSTSGDYERYYIHEGRRYSHIIDPKTGYPADNGMVSATVFAKSAALADALSTALIVMGKESAVNFIKAHDDLTVFLVGENSFGTNFENYTLLDDTYVKNPLA